jgi:hypothetical protein
MYDVACSPNVSVRMAWISFGALPFRKKKKKSKMDDSSRLDVVELAHASPDLLPFSVCDKRRLAFQHMNRTLFPMTLSIPPYVIGKWVGLRTYRHPHVASSIQIEMCGFRVPPWCKWAITQPRMVIREIMHSYWNFLALNMWPTGCPETSVRDYHSTLRNIPEQRRFHPCKYNCNWGLVLLFCWKL